MLSGLIGAAGAVLLAGCAEDAATAPGQTGAPAKTGFLEVPGAGLYYEVRGSGPVLLMIHGGAGEAGVFASIAPLLASRYQVVTYDRRGSSRSRLDGPVDEVQVADHADDARRLLDHFGAGLSHVFGSSGGATIALDLAARRPRRLGTVVAHEPPVYDVLPDRARYRAVAEEVHGTYRRSGADAAMEVFMKGVDDPDGDAGAPEADAVEPDRAMLERLKADEEFFVAHEVRAFMGYKPDIAALKEGPARIVLGLGRHGGTTARRMSAVTADLLGAKAVEFPSGHMGYMDHPRAFATKLIQVLA
ncbi:alpha/beta fold hydrolase [Microbispora sp. NPDC049125]|uniref:alpha/beta fold hydrolase n=1 Tax=Microbispora sp. NPDC049125 TaxID=3154929 RepID=UPI0034661684